MKNIKRVIEFLFPSDVKYDKTFLRNNDLEKSCVGKHEDFPERFGDAVVVFLYLLLRAWEIQPDNMNRVTSAADEDR